MAPKPGFKRNPKTVAKILKTHDGGKRAAVQRMFDSLPPEVQAEARIEVYTTDREVVALVVPADAQAREGVATRAGRQRRTDTGMIPDYVHGVKEALLTAAPTPFDATLEIPTTFDPVAGTPVVLVADDGGPAVLRGAWMVGASPYRPVLRLTAYATGRTEARATVVAATEYVVANKPGIARVENVSVPLITKDRETGAMLASITVPVIVKQTA